MGMEMEMEMGWRSCLYSSGFLKRKREQWICIASNQHYLGSVFSMSSLVLGNREGEREKQRRTDLDALELMALLCILLYLPVLLFGTQISI